MQSRDCRLSLPLLSLRFQESRFSLFFPFWQWKLSSFSSSSQVGILPEIRVLLSRSGVLAPDEYALIAEDRDAFFVSRFHRLPEGQILYTIQKTGSDYIYLQYIYDPLTAEIILTEDKTETAGLAAVERIGRFFPALILQYGGLTIHGVLMEHERRGIIISAPSGVGKSTYAHLWRDYRDAIIINGDLSSCYKKETNSRSVWTGFGTPWCGTSGEYMNREVPITAIVVLERGEKNETHRLEGVDAFGAVYPQLQLPVWDHALAETGVDLLLNMLEEIPVFRLRCRPDAESVEVLDAALREL